MKPFGEVNSGCFLALATLVVVTSCAAPTSPRTAANSQTAEEPRAASRVKTIVVGVTSPAQAMGVMGGSTTTGGWHSLSELHANGLMTSDFDTRKLVPRLANKVPSLQDGAIALLPDGRMRVTYTLRKDVTWQDGTPFTAHDLAFSYRFNSDPGIPTLQSEGQGYISGVEAADDFAGAATHRPLSLQPGRL